MPHSKPDLLIVGAGCIGATLARLAADQGRRVLVLEKRFHIAGNCFDQLHESGMWIHRYGPHYFRTNDEGLLAFLSRFTDWIGGKYFVRVSTGNRLYPFPINLTTLEMFFNRSFTEEEARDYLEKKRHKIEKPANSEEFVLSRVGEELYRAFYEGYTKKQWGLSPRELDASVCGRIPVRFNRDERYVEHRHQLLPKEGYTAMFGRMLSHPNITVLLGTNYLSLRESLHPRIATVYSGPLDEYFNLEFGRLPWRSLEFRYEKKATEFFQPCVQVNYPQEHEYTRTLEYKHLNTERARAQKTETLVCYETPCAEGEPFYPIPQPENKVLEKYLSRAEEEKQRRKVFFAGRLATYKYMNMDEAFLSAISLARDILS